MLRKLTAGAVPLLLLLLTCASDVSGIPAFARRYHASCTLCHAPVPRLNAFGEQFAANGFRFAPGEEPRDTIDTGDDLLQLGRQVPLAVRLEAYLQALGDAGPERATFDLQTPYGIKLLSGGPIADKVSYYMYFFLTERGELTGLEDAFLHFDDVLGTGVDLVAGQFQISDPLFKRELRLEFEDYAPFRVRVGAARADLTYDRGLMATLSPWSGGDLVVELINGRGLTEAGDDRQFDQDDYKSVAGRFSQDLGPARVGVFAYYGNEERRDAGESLSDEILVFGPDLTLTPSDRLELNVQALRRRDDDPFFLGSPDAETTVDALFAELVWGPAGPLGRWFLTGLYNWVDATDSDALVPAEVFTLRQGEDTGLSRYQTAALDATYLLRRNLRLIGEGQWDFEVERPRFTLGVMTAF